MSASATPTGPPLANGQCGKQHGMARCLPMQNRQCCSVDGYCGFNETYCLVENGCQYGCVDACIFFGTCTSSTTSSSFSTTFLSSPTSLATISAKSTTTTSQISTTNPKSTSLTNSPQSGESGLTGRAKIGVIAGCSAFGIFLILLLIALLVRRNKKRQQKREREAAAAAAAAAANKPVTPPPPEQFYNGFISVPNLLARDG